MQMCGVGAEAATNSRAGIYLLMSLVSRIHSQSFCLPGHKDRRKHKPDVLISERDFCLLYWVLTAKNQVNFLVCGNILADNMILIRLLD